MKLKLLLLCCLSVIGLVSSRVTKYEKDTAYQYSYAGYILSGAPDHSNSYTGFFIHTKVYLRYIRNGRRNRYFSMQFINPNITKIAGDISPVFPQRFDSPSKLKQQKRHERYDGLSKEVLELPVQFAWSKLGYVKSLRKSPAEKNDSLNIKRSVLSMLSGNFGLIPVNHRAGVKIVKGAKTTGVEGNCETTSHFQRIGRSLFEYIKIRQVDKCTQVPFTIRSNFPKAFRTPCVGKRPSRLMADSQTRVLVHRKTNDAFFIEKSVVHSRYGARAPSRRRQDAVTRVKQVLKFVTVASTDTKSSTRGYQTASLIMDLPSTPDKPGTDFMKEVNDTLKIMSENRLKPEYVKQQFVLVQLLRKASAKQIGEIIKSVKSKGARFAIMKLLSAVGTEASIKVLIHRLRNTSVPQEVSAALATTSATTASNPKALFNGFKTILKDKIFTESKHRKTVKAILLGSGTLLGAIKTPRRTLLVKKLKFWFSKLMKGDLSKLMDNETKTVILLKSIGNTGFHEISDILADYIKADKSLNVRLAAMRAWRKLIRKIPRSTAYTMFPIFANRKEDTEIRINAFMMMMRAGPHSTSRIGYFSHLLMRETDVNLRNFVMSALLTISKSKTKSACFIAMKLTCRKLLRRLPRAFQEIDKTKSIMFVKQTPLYWVDLFGYIIYTKDSMLPRTIYISDAMVGENSVAKSFEVQIRSLNNQANLRKFAQRLGILRKFMKKGNTTFADLKAKKNATRKKRGTMVVELSIFGEDVMSKESNTVKMISKLLKGYDISSGYVLQDHFVQATSFGLPLTLDRSMGFKGKLKIKHEYKLTEKRQISVETTASRSHSYMIEGTLGTNIGKTHSKVGLDLSASLNPGGEISIKTKTLISKGSLSTQISMLPPGKEHKLAFLKLDPYLLIGSENSTKLNRRDMTASRRVPPVTKVYKSKYTRIPQVKVHRSSRNLKSSIPAFFEVSVLNGSVFGIAIDVKGEDLEVKESEDEDSTEDDEVTEPQIEVLKAVNSTGESDDDASLLPYSVGSTIALKDMNKKLSIKFSLLALQRKTEDSEVTSQKVNILNADVSLKSKGGSLVNLDLTASNRENKTIFSAAGVTKNIGPAVYFNPNNPFQVTTNMKRVRQFRLSRDGRTLFSVNATSVMSDRWVQRWKNLLKKPKIISRAFPQIYRCILDGQKNSDYSNSPNCIHTWETLQVFDTHNVRLSFVRPLRPFLKKFNGKISEKLKSYFTKLDIEPGDNQTTLQMSISQMDRKGRRHLRGYRAMRRGHQFSSTCDVGIYKSNQQLIVNSFDGFRYNTNVTSKLFKNQSLIIAEDRFGPKPGYRSIGGGFTVAFTYGKKPYTLVHYILFKKACTVKLMLTEDGTETESDGPGCTDKQDRDTFKIDIGSAVVKDAIRMTVPYLKLTVVTRPSHYASVTVRKSHHFNSLRGICGNFDGLALRGEFLGKSCERPMFRDLKKFTSDYVVEDPTNVPKCS